MPHAVSYLNTCEPGHNLIRWNMFYFIVKKIKKMHIWARTLFDEGVYDLFPYNNNKKKIRFLQLEHLIRAGKTSFPTNKLCIINLHKSYN